jgi:hypothetical protein
VLGALQALVVECLQWRAEVLWVETDIIARQQNAGAVAGGILDGLCRSR